MASVSKIPAFSVNQFLETARSGDHVTLRDGKDLARAGLLDRIKSALNIGSVREKENLNTINAFKQALKSESRYKDLASTIDTLIGEIGTKRPLSSWRIGHVVKKLNQAATKLTQDKPTDSMLFLMDVSQFCNPKGRVAVAMLKNTGIMNMVDYNAPMQKYFTNALVNHETFRNHDFAKGPVNSSEIRSVFRTLVSSVSAYDNEMRARSIPESDRRAVFALLAESDLPLLESGDKKNIARHVDDLLRTYRPELNEGGDKTISPEDVKSRPPLPESTKSRMATQDGKTEIMDSVFGQSGLDVRNSYDLLYKMKRGVNMDGKGMHTGVRGFNSSDMMDCVLHSILAHDKVRGYDFGIGTGPAPRKALQEAFSDIIDTINQYDSAMISRAMPHYDRYVFMQQLVKYDSFTPQSQQDIGKRVDEWVEQRQKSIEALRN